MLGTIYTLDLDLFKDIISFPFFFRIFSRVSICVNQENIFYLGTTS